MSSINKEIVHNLSAREVDVLEVFWTADKPLISSELNNYNPSLTKGTIQAIIKSLTKKKLIKVDNIVYSGTVLARSYVPIISASEYAQFKIYYDVNKFTKFSPKSSIIAALLESEKNPEELFDELEDMIREKRNKINKEEN